MLRLPTADLRAIVQRLSTTAPTLMADLKHAKIFVTGGTGFFGKWLLESFLAINRELDLQASLTTLTRDIAGFRARFPHLFSEPSLHFWEGDLHQFSFPHSPFTHLIHTATLAGATHIQHHPQAVYDTILAGTRQVLAFAKKAGVHRFLFTSSGAVYGHSPHRTQAWNETEPLTLDPMHSTSCLGIGKLQAEHLCHLAGIETSLEPIIARCFSFIGPHYPLSGHFAVGNFIRNLLDHEPIVIHGDGSPVRSFLYAADLMVWLWTLLTRGRANQIYHVGSDQAVSIGELAHKIQSHANARDRSPVVIERNRTQSSGATDFYVPNIAKAKTELNLEVWTSLDRAIEKTLQWSRPIRSHLK